MPKIGKRLKRFAFTLAILSAATITAVGAYLAWGSSTFDEFVFFAITAAITPPTITNYLDHRWRRSIDEHLPDMFRSIVQAQETGMTLPRAFEEAAKRDYGPLTAELRKINVQISWGMTLEEALLSFARRV
ncbi:MAG: type II secretion system F family protein, partial [Candidatus Bathyarchaeia archaeon]